MTASPTAPAERQTEQVGGDMPEIPSEIIIKKLGVAERLTEKAIGMGARITSPRDLKKHFKEMYTAITEAVNTNDYGEGSGKPDNSCGRTPPVLPAIAGIAAPVPSGHNGAGEVCG